VRKDGGLSKHEDDEIEADVAKTRKKKTKAAKYVRSS